jgi:putative hemin transport protein
MFETMRNAKELRRRLAAIRAAEKHRSLRHAARRLGVSEAELIAAFAGGAVTRLDKRWGALLSELPALGPVMVLTRNEHTVIEKTGTYAPFVEMQGGTGLILGKDIDLRLFLDRWWVGYAVGDDGEFGLRRSLQFFDSSGVAVHKIFLTEGSDQRAFDALVARHAAGDQSPGEIVHPVATTAVERPNNEIDAAGLRAAWADLRDTHDFVDLLHRFGATRTQALRLAGREWAEPLPASTLRAVLEAAAATDLPIMVFVGNHGAIEIHTGPVRRVLPMGVWLNVLDPGFNLHVHEPGVASAWVVRKPTVDGVVTSVELFGKQGETVALLYGKRKPGQAEMDDWRRLVAALART